MDKQGDTPMTTEDQFGIIGKAWYDYREAKEQFGFIQARGRQIAEAAHTLAEAVLEPGRVLVLAEGEAAVFAGVRSPFLFAPVVARQLTQENVRQHVEEYKAAQQRVAALRRRLVSLGQDDPE
jgi:hypothetical protein